MHIIYVGKWETKLVQGHYYSFHPLKRVTYPPLDKWQKLDGGRDVGREKWLFQGVVNVSVTPCPWERFGVVVFDETWSWSTILCSLSSSCFCPQRINNHCCAPYSVIFTNILSIKLYNFVEEPCDMQRIIHLSMTNPLPFISPLHVCRCASSPPKLPDMLSKENHGCVCSRT